jgi:hypothetical protein
VCLKGELTLGSAKNFTAKGRNDRDDSSCSRQGNRTGRLVALDGNVSTHAEFHLVGENDE